MAAPVVAVAGRAAAKLATTKKGRSFLAWSMVVILALPAMLLAMPALAIMAVITTFGNAQPPWAEDGIQTIPACASILPASELELMDVDGYTGEQMVNAGIIVSTGVQKQIPTLGVKIAVMTAMGESSLINVDHGDKVGPDSRGLFQQRDNWGTEKERMDPATAAGFFYDALMAVDGWKNMEPTLAAHEVQKNADPQHYAKYWETAVKIVGKVVTREGCPQGAYPVDQPYNITSGYGPRSSPTPGASSWHPAFDFGKACGEPVYAVGDGVVELSNSLWLSIRHPDGYLISYLHMYKKDRLVDVGDSVIAGDQIGVVGNAGPSTGCHLDLRINVGANTNPDVDQLETSDEIGGPPGYVNPAEFMALFGIDICPEEWCSYV